MSDKLKLKVIVDGDFWSPEQETQNRYNKATTEVSPDSNPWEELLSEYTDEYKPHMELIKKWVLLQDATVFGEDMNELCFSFSDGSFFDFSFRAWGAVMDAIIGKKEGYMAYYMRGFINDGPKLEYKHLEVD